jgi:hypothetical protein
VVIAIAVIAVAAGVGVVGVAAVVTLLALLVWRGGEALVGRLTRRRPRHAEGRTAAAGDGGRTR